jgi:hypothetical protein
LGQAPVGRIGRPFCRQKQRPTSDLQFEPSRGSSARRRGATATDDEDGVAAAAATGTSLASSVAAATTVAASKAVAKTMTARQYETFKYVVGRTIGSGRWRS